MAWLGVITNNGNDLLTRWVEGKNLHITRAAAGQGRVEQTAMLAQSALVNEKQTVSIVSNTPAERGQRLKLQGQPKHGSARLSTEAAHSARDRLWKSFLRKPP